jgi:hypothetical protein
MMTEKDFNLLMELVESKLKQKLSKEEARQSLIDAGIFDEQGNYTEPYKIPETVTKPRAIE